MLELLDVTLERGMNWYGQCDDSDDVYTLVLVSYGKCVYWINADKLILEKGDVLLIPPRSAYYGKSVPTVFHEKLVARFMVVLAAVRELPLLAQQDFVQARPGRFEWMLERLRVLHAEWTDRTPYAE